MKEGKIKGKERSKKKKILRSLKKLKRVKNTLPLIFKLEKKKAKLPGPVVSNTLTRQRSSE
jgi:hypothetical protein